MCTPLRTARTTAEICANQDLLVLDFGTNKDIQFCGHHDGVDIYIWVLENEIIFGSFAV